MLVKSAHCPAANAILRLSVFRGRLQNAFWLSGEKQKMSTEPRDEADGIDVEFEAVTQIAKALSGCC